MKNLKEKIISLIQSHREGPYWDFKEIAYTKEKNADFVHDVLCMANSVTNCDKYIIMGVSDPGEGCKIKGLVCERKCQADYIDILRGLRFADVCPEIELRTIKIRKKEIDVLIIKESALKPFYLIERYQKVEPYRIYTRTLDSNTPVDKSADFSVIERMWRQRFNLDLPPKEKFEKILEDKDNWHIDVGNEENAYYELAPEYQIVFSELDEGEECYSHFFCNERAFFGTAEFKYHSTTLLKMQYGTVDEMRIYIAIPQTAGFSSKQLYFYYYFIKGSLSYKFQELICGVGLDFSRAGNIYNPFLVFESEDERKNFNKYLKNIPDLNEKIENHEYGNYLYKKKQHPNMRFLAFAIDAYREWKNKVEK